MLSAFVFTITSLHVSGNIFVIKSAMVIVNVYLIIHFHLSKSSWIINVTNVSDEVLILLTCYS